MDLVVGRLLFNVIDHQHRYRTFRRDHFDPDLLIHRVHQRDAAARIGSRPAPAVRACRPAGRIAAAPAAVIAIQNAGATETEREIVSAVEAR